MHVKSTRPGSVLRVGISISESPDMDALGMSHGHLRDAVARYALNILSMGMSLIYGGDLRKVNGFTTFLFEMLTRYGNHPHHQGPVSVTSFLAWPVHIGMHAADLEEFSKEHADAASIELLNRDGSRLDWQKRLEMESREPDENEWAEGLTSMRRTMCDATIARVVIGGRVEGYRGRMPGIAEEVRLSLEAGQPVYLIGGFGGCTRDIAETMGLVERWSGSRDDWPERKCFESFRSEDLGNGLSHAENDLLARTPHVEQAIMQVRSGLRKVLKSRMNDA